jgi:hypothetical protein
MQDTLTLTTEYSSDSIVTFTDTSAAKCDSDLLQVCVQQFGVAIYFLIGFWLLTIALMIVSNWIIFEKAGRKGWESIVPIYSTVVFFKIIGKSLWNLLWILTFIGTIVLVVKVCSGLAKSFGKSSGFAWGLALFPIIFQAIIAFDKSIVYAGPNGANLPKDDDEED